MAATCPWCKAPRAAGPTCPSCGANYEEAIKAILGTPDERAVQDPAFEFKLCAAAIPAMLVVALLFHLYLPGMQRIFLGMPIHELGHALTAWFCGHWAIPTLGKTIISEERGWLTPIVLGGGPG